jgi:lipooligosaccharide transport system permease protein
MLGSIGVRSLFVWRRDFDVYMKTWMVNFFPPLLEPVIYLVAFGSGLGTLVSSVPYAGRSISYAAFVAPGVLAITILFQGFFECAYGSYIRMYYQKTYDAIIATPVSLEEVVTGEVLWGATKSVIGAFLVGIVVVAFGYAPVYTPLAVLPLAALSGLLFASMSMCFTGVVPNIDAFNYPVFLLITPMFVFSGTFFPLAALPPWARFVADLLPLTHVANLCRALTQRVWDPRLVIDVVWLVGISAVLFPLSVVLLRRRIIQ